MDTGFELFLKSPNSIVKLTSQATLTQMLNFVFQRADINNSITTLSFDDFTEASSDSVTNPNVCYQNDAVMVFETLCKYASVPPTDSDTLGSKILGLQILLSVKKSCIV